MTAVLGIDPGLRGALVLVADGHVALAQPLPVTASDDDRQELDRAKLLAILRAAAARHEGLVAVLERSQPLPGQGIASTFRYGVGYGVIAMALEAAAIPFRTVRPRAWQSELGTALPSSPGELSKAQRRAALKRRALQLVLEQLPELEVVRGRTWHDGLVDAACLALYGLRCPVN